MREDKLNFGVIIRTFVSLLPVLFGVPLLAIITCAYNIVMSFVVFGPLNAVATSLCSVCISMFIGEFTGAGGELYGFVIAIQAVLAAIGCIYGYLIKKKFSLGMYFSTAGILIPQFMYIQSQAASNGLTVAEAIVPSVEEIKLIVQETLMTIPESEIPFGAYEVNLISFLTQKITKMMIPAAFIISSLVLAYIVVWAVSVQLRKVPAGITHSFSHIKVSKSMSIVFLVLINALIVFMVLGYNLEIPESIYIVCLNMIMILATICLFSGISFVDFYLRKAIRFTALRVLIYVGTMFAIPAVCIAYMLAGCVDGFADFRRLKKITDKKGEFDEAEK